MEALDALGNPVRRQILEHLRSGPAPVGELAERFPVSRPAISRHLRVLEQAGLVSHSAEGRQNLYRLEPRGFAAAQDYLATFWDDALARFKLVTENLEAE